MNRLSLLLSLLLSACAQIAGIEERSLDPKFRDGGTSDLSNLSQTELCPIYCQQVAKKCPASLVAVEKRTNGEAQHSLVYGTESLCRNICNTLPFGSKDNSGVNTLWCRVNTVNQELVERDECAVLGLPGNSVSPDAGVSSQRCGAKCQSFCSLMFAKCSNAPGMYKTMDDCLAACSLIPDLGTYEFTTDFYKGNSIQCRFTHLQNVFGDSQSPSVHCEHALGISQCVP